MKYFEYIDVYYAVLPQIKLDKYFFVSKRHVLQLIPRINDLLADIIISKISERAFKKSNNKY